MTLCVWSWGLGRGWYHGKSRHSKPHAKNIRANPRRPEKSFLHNGFLLDGADETRPRLACHFRHFTALFVVGKIRRFSVNFLRKPPKIQVRPYP
jgi:hypothetical protein